MTHHHTTDPQRGADGGAGLALADARSVAHQQRDVLDEFGVIHARHDHFLLAHEVLRLRDRLAAAERVVEVARSIRKLPGDHIHLSETGWERMRRLRESLAAYDATHPTEASSPASEEDAHE